MFYYSNTYFHDHYKASLAGHSDSNADEDTGKLHITYANNYWKNINSRQPLLRFGTAHVINSYYEGGTVGESAVNTRMGKIKQRAQTATFQLLLIHSFPLNRRPIPR